MQDFFKKYGIDDSIIAAGVSGGADSLALVWKLKTWAEKYNKKIVALTVDHGLRPESAAEARYVASLMNEWHIEHHILCWNGEKPVTGIEEAARHKRYELLREWCALNNVAVLAVAHHQYDQAETFFMRVQRGSGLDGLCGMLPVTLWNGLKIIRPLLHEAPQNLRKLLKENHIRWVEDPSNRNDDFLRVRIRKFLPILEEKTGISIARIVSAMDNLAAAREYLEEQCEKFIRAQVRNWDNAGFSFSLGEWRRLHSELKFRILNRLLKESTKRAYPPRAESGLRLLERMENDTFKSATLGGCHIISFDKKIWIVPELKVVFEQGRKDWKEWVNTHPSYKKLKLPSKLRLSLLINHPIYKQ